MVEITKVNTLLPAAPEPIRAPAQHGTIFEKFRSMYCKLVAGILLSVSTNIARSEDMPEVTPQLPARRFFIGGGGHLPERAHKKFIEMAGGKSAKVLVVPTASEDAKDDKNIDSYWRWKEYVGEAKLMHADASEEADQDLFIEEMKNATAFWFGGGEQLEFVKRYRHTKFHRALQEFSEKGGLIGGSSAGASAMSRIMIKEGEYVAELDEGFGFVPWAVIDQHHLRKGRPERLLGVSKKHPEQLCLGIKDRTAMIIHWTSANVTATVIGDGDVRILRNEQELKVLNDGDTIDFATLQMVIPPLDPNKSH